MGLREDVNSKLDNFGRKLDEHLEKTSDLRTDVEVLKNTTVSISECETRRNVVFKEVRKVGKMNKIFGGIATGISIIAATLAGIFGFGGK